MTSVLRFTPHDDRNTATYDFDQRAFASTDERGSFVADTHTRGYKIKGQIVPLTRRLRVLGYHLKLNGTQDTGTQIKLHIALFDNGPGGTVRFLHDNNSSVNTTSPITVGAEQNYGYRYFPAPGLLFKKGVYFFLHMPNTKTDSTTELFPREFNLIVEG